MGKHFWFWVFLANHSLFIITVNEEGKIDDRAIHRAVAFNVPYSAQKGRKFCKRCFVARLFCFEEVHIAFI